MILNWASLMHLSWEWWCEFTLSTCKQLIKLRFRLVSSEDTNESFFIPCRRLRRQIQLGLMGKNAQACLSKRPSFASKLWLWLLQSVLSLQRSEVTCDEVMNSINGRFTARLVSLGLEVSLKLQLILAKPRPQEDWHIERPITVFHYHVMFRRGSIVDLNKHPFLLW